MDNYSVLEFLKHNNTWELKALDFIRVFGRRPSGTDLIEIYNISPELYGLKENNPDVIQSSRLIYYENDNFDSSTNIKLSKVDRFIEMTPHMHDFFEVECVLQGKCIHIVEQQNIALTSGDFVIIPPNVEHKVCPEDDCIIVNLMIRRRTFEHAFVNLLSTNTELSTYLSRTLYSTTYRSSFTFHCGNDTFLQSLILSMFGQYRERKPFFNHMLEGMTLTLFSYLIQNHAQNIEISNFVISNNDRMTKIIAYLNKNYQTVTLQALAKKFFVTEPYLSSFIKKETGSTFSSLLRQIRMQKAQTLLLTSALKVEDICEECGYQDATQFIKTFKAYYGTTPKKYRNNSQFQWSYHMN